MTLLATLKLRFNSSEPKKEPKKLIEGYSNAGICLPKEKLKIPKNKKCAASDKGSHLRNIEELSIKNNGILNLSTDYTDCLINNSSV